MIYGAISALIHGSHLSDDSSSADPQIFVEPNFNFHAVYYKEKPYIYIDNTTSQLTGIIPEIFQKINKKCYGFKIDLEWDVSSSDNFTALLWGNRTNRELRNEYVIWLPLLRKLNHGDKHQLKDVNLTDTPLFPILGMEVLVQRRKIGIVSKIALGLADCSNLFLLALVLAVLFGITIWLCVSMTREK